MKIDSKSKYYLDKIGIGFMVTLLVTIQLAFFHMLYKSHQKIKNLEKEELAYKEFIDRYKLELEEYDDWLSL